jgi:hypothetical protein
MLVTILYDGRQVFNDLATSGHCSIPLETTMTLVEQLQSDQSQISAIIKAHSEQVETSSPANPPMDMLHQVYIDSLEDALKTLTSMLDYLGKQT